MGANTAFVTGATGFVGLNLVEALVARGWRVTAMHRPESDLTPLARFDVRCVVGDLTDPLSVAHALEPGTDVVFHVAANTSLWSRRHREQDAVNVEGTRHVVKAALDRRAGRLVHTSSIVAYGLHGGLITEDTPTRGTASTINYVRSKALAEREVRLGIRRGLDAVIVNPANIIGAYDTQNWARMFLLLARGRLPGVPPGGGSFCHARAVAQAHIAAAERGRSGCNYLLGGVEASYRGFALEIARCFGRRARVRTYGPRVSAIYARIEEWMAPVFAREPEVTRETIELMACNLYCSSKRAMAELGYQPAPLSEMVGDCAAWLRGAGLIPA